MKFLRLTHCVFLGLGVVCISASAVDISTDKQRYIVEFAESGVMHYNGNQPSMRATAPEKLNKQNRAGHFDVQAPEVETYRNYLKGTQGQHIAEIEAQIEHKLTIHHRYDLTLSGMAVELTASEATVIAKMTGIESLTPDRKHKLATYRSPAFIGAPSIWNGSATPDKESTLAGAGITIGIFDTGYNSSHPAFADTVCTFAPHKVLSGVDCTKTDRCEPAPASPAFGDPDPEDYRGHGSHTASTAAGNIVTTGSVPMPANLPPGYTSMSGVAPCSSLRIYKVCVDSTSRTTNCLNSDVMAAQQQVIMDGDVDVINFSIGGDGETAADVWSPTSDTQRGFLDTFNAGSVVVAAAGNTNPDEPFIPLQVNNLGPWMLTVAASTSDGVQVNNTPGTLSVIAPGTLPASLQNIPMTMSTSADIPANQSGAGPTTSDLPGILGPPLITNPAYLYDFPTSPTGCSNPDGSSPYRLVPGWFSGAIALIQRGSCGYVQQITNVEAAGAVAAVIYDNTAEVPFDILPLYTSVIPVSMISQTNGEALVNYLGEHSDGVTINVTPPGARGDVLANFSLRGSNIIMDVTKPDISAPGVTIYAALNAFPLRDSSGDPIDDDTPLLNYGHLSGTSMATPHVAGAVALVRGVHPDWSPVEVMSALRMTAFNGGTQEDGVTPWTPDQVGNGRVDLTKAALAGLVMDETYTDFINANPIVTNSSTGLPGDPKTLNLPAVRNTQCRGSCSWTRTVRNTFGYSAAWNVESIADAIATGSDGIMGVANIAIFPWAFTLAPRGMPGDIQVLTITATILPRPSGSDPLLGFGAVTLQGATPDAFDRLPPDARITIAVQSISDTIFADSFGFSQ